MDPRDSSELGARPGLLVRLDVSRRSGLWRFEEVACEEEDDLVCWREVPVEAGEMRALGVSDRTVEDFEHWVDAAAADDRYPLHIRSVEHWDDIGLELWARTIFDLRDGVPAAYQSVAGLGRLWRIPSAEWVARKRVRLRARWSPPRAPSPGEPPPRAVRPPSSELSPVPTTPTLVATNDSTENRRTVYLDNGHYFDGTQGS